jgi:hypothetical protein
MTTQTDFENKPEIKALPEAVQKKLVSFIYTEIPKIPFFKPDGKPKKEWKIFYGDTWDAAYGAAYGAARDAAYGAARDATRGAAWDAAYDAAYDAASGAAWGAARDAAIMSDYLITSDLKFKDKDKHLKHVLARWEVWQKGYGLLCDVDGVLYVYDVKLKKPLVNEDFIVNIQNKQIAELQAKIEKAKAVLA